MAASMQENVNGFSPAPSNAQFAYGVDNKSSAQPSPRRQYGGAPGQNQGPYFKIFIQNLPLDLTKENLQGLFSKFGDISSVNILAPKEGYLNTIGFIGFATAEQASAAIEQMNGATLDESHVLKVEKARDRGEKPNRMQQGGRQDRGHFSSSGPGRGMGGGFQEQQTFNVNGPGRGGNLNGGSNQSRNPGQQGQQQRQDNFGGGGGGGGYQKGAHFNAGQGSQRGSDPRHVKGGHQSQGYQQPGNFNASGPDQQGNYEQGQFNSQGTYNIAPGNGYQQQGQFDSPAAYNGQDNFAPFTGSTQHIPEQQFNSHGSSPQQRSAGYEHGFQEQAYYNPPLMQGNFNSVPSYQMGAQYNPAVGQDGYVQPGSFSPSVPEQSYENQGQMYQGQGASGYHSPGQFDYAPGYQEQGPVCSPAVQGGFHGPGNISPDAGQGYPSQPLPGSSAETGPAPGYGGNQNEERPHASDSSQVHPQQEEWNDAARGTEHNTQGNFDSGIPGQGQPHNNINHQSYPDQNGPPGQGMPSPGHHGGRDTSQNYVSGRLPHTATSSSGQGSRACHKCGEEGHFARECPSQGTRGSGACHLCGEDGHFARECPSRGNTSGDNSCFKCGEAGHFSRECPNQSRGSGDRACHKCGEQGHFARECPSQGNTGSGDRACHKCGEQGHFARECPSQGNTGSGDRACHKCGEQGHFARECPSQGNTGSGNRACHKCGEEGHFSRECPSQGNTGDSCFKCGEVGHFSRECPNQSGRGDNACHKCGEEGHFARECPSQGDAGENRVAPVTYVPPELDDVNTLFEDVHPSGINFDKYDHIPVQVTGQNPPPAISVFEEAGLLEQCAANVRRAKYMKPTPIQKHSIPIVLSGRDLMSCAQTGSGKTAAFLLPVMTSMIRQGNLSGGSLVVGETQYPTALCIAPTRELVMQIHLEACKFSDGTVIKSAVCYGGVSVQYQLSTLQRGCHFLVATPGRLEDFISRNRISLENVKYLILDEADRMLDMGFEPVIRKIVERCGMPPKSERQTLMFSATFPDEIQKLAADFLRQDYLFVAVGRVGGSNHDITQNVIPMHGDDKRDKLFEILQNSGTDRILVFVELKRIADFLACLLSQNKFPTTSISGDRTQNEREAALRDFRAGRAPVLVATSVAARGLDIRDVKHVINYDLPREIDEYVHRIGRTGRIGNKGQATSFFEQGKDEKLARSLVKVLAEASQVVPDWLERCAESAIGTSYGPAGGRFTSRDHRERENRPRNDMQSVTEGVSSMAVNGPRAGSGYGAQQDDEESWD